jgi:NADH-quinone oxidoreductase subunit I
VATTPKPDGSLNVDRYEIDFRLCMYCGLCVEACPYQAIQAGGDFRDAVYVFDDMYKDRPALTKLAHQYLRQHDFNYPHGQKAPDRLIERLGKDGA